MSESDRRRERRRMRDRAAGVGQYRGVAEALARGVAPGLAALAWLGWKETPSSLADLKPGPKTFESAKAVTERLLDACRFGLPEVPLLIGLDAVERYVLCERSGYELSTRGSRYLDGTVSVLKRWIQLQRPPAPKGEGASGLRRSLESRLEEVRRIANYPDPDDADHDIEDEDNPYEGVEGERYTYGDEMNFLKAAASATEALLEVALDVLFDDKPMPDFSSPPLMDPPAGRWPAVDGLETIIEYALGNEGSGVAYVADPDELEGIFRGVTWSAIASLKSDLG